MKPIQYQLTVVQRRRDLVQLEEAAGHVGLHPDVVRHFVDFGLLEPAEICGSVVLLDLESVHRLEVIQRMRCDLGINLAGIGVILDLLDRIDALRRGGMYGYQ